LVNDSQADLVKNLKNLEPTIRALADVGPELGTAVAAGFVFPFNQNFVDRAVRGDYFNISAELDLSIPRLKKGLMLGTHWGQPGMPEPPLPGDPYYLQYTHDPMHDPIRPPWVDPGALPLPGPPPGAAPLPGPPPGTAPLPDAGLAQTPPPATAPAEGGG
jgi:phospholipid/cholesterol/gamma-HCH transport system substrate-binding protein